MTQANLAVVRGVYDAFARGNVPGIFGLFHPEAVVYQSSRLPWGGEYRGHEELGAFLTKLTGALESKVEPERFIDDEEEGHVVQIGRPRRGRVRATGNECDVPETHVWTVEDGRVIRFESYIDTPKMREALGLQPGAPPRRWCLRIGHPHREAERRSQAAPPGPAGRRLSAGGCGPKRYRPRRGI